MRQQKADRLAAEEAARAKAGAALASQPGGDSSSDTLVSQPSKPHGKLGGAAPPPQDSLIDHIAQNLPEKSALKPRPVSQMLNNMFRRGRGDDAASGGGSSDAPSVPAKEQTSGGTQLPLLPPPRPDRPRTPNPHATPRSSISEPKFVRAAEIELTLIF